MPGGDRTGPYGRGPMTGRGAGYGGGYDVPGYMNRYGGRRCGFGRGYGGGRGAGMGRGMGFGYGRGAGAGFMRRGAFFPPEPVDMPYPPGETETELLRREAENLEASLAAVKERLSRLEASGEPAAKTEADVQPGETPKK